MALIAHRRAERNDLQFYRCVSVSVLQNNSLFGDRNRILARFFKQRSQFVEQAWARHFEQVQTGPAAGKFQEAAGLPPALHDLQIVAHHHGGRDIPGQQQTIGFALHIDRRLGRFVFLAFMNRPHQHALRVLPDRQPERGRRRHRFLPVNLALAVYEIENFRARSEQAFAIPDQQKPVFFQSVVENRNNPLLESGTQIDQNIPATDQVHARERRIVEYILPRENAYITNRFRNLISAGRFMKKAPQPNFRDLSRYGLFVKAGPRPLNGGFAKIGAENLDGHVDAQFGKDFYQRNRVRVGFLASRTPGDPYPNRFRGRAFREQLGIYEFAQTLEYLRIAKETC